MAGARLTASTLVAALLLSGCTGGLLSPGERDRRGSGSLSPGPASSSATSPSATSSQTAPVDPRARRDVDRALTRLLRARTGRVTTVLAFGPSQVRDEVRFDLLRGYTLRREFDEYDGTDLAIEGVVIGQQIWYQVSAADRPTTCYIHTTFAALGSFQALPVMALTRPRPRVVAHQAVRLVATVRGTHREPDVGDTGLHQATVRAATVLDLIGPRVVDEVDLDRGTPARAAATVRIAGGRLTALQVSGPALVAALTEAGADTSLLESDAGSLLIMLSFSQPGLPVELAPPPAGEVVELGTGQEFESEMTACVRRYR